jgi:hypothetical protein
MMLSLHKTEEALELFQEALTLFQQLKPESEAVAENHFCVAEALLDHGNVQLAIEHGEKAKMIRQNAHGPTHPKTIDSYQQLGTIAYLFF